MKMQSVMGLGVVPVAEPGEPRVQFRFESKRGWCRISVPLAMSLEEAIEACDAYGALAMECEGDARRKLQAGKS